MSCIIESIHKLNKMWEQVAVIVCVVGFFCARFGKYIAQKTDKIVQIEQQWRACIAENKPVEDTVPFIRAYTNEWKRESDRVKAMLHLTAKIGNVYEEMIFKLVPETLRVKWHAVDDVV